MHDIFNTKLYTQLTYIPKLYIPTTMCQNGTGKPSKLPSSPKSWHCISTTKLYTQLTHIPKMYIPTKMCQDGTRKPSKLHSSPKCWHVISNTKLFIQLTYISQIVGTIYEYSYITLTYIYFQKNCSIIQYIYIVFNLFHTKCISKI